MDLGIRKQVCRGKFKSFQIVEKYLKILEGKRFFRKSFKRKEKGHRLKSQRMCKASIFDEQLIYV